MGDNLSRQKELISDLLGAFLRIAFIAMAVKLSCQNSRSEEATNSPSIVFEAVCRALADNYPMLEYSGWSKEWRDEFRGRINTATNEEDGFWLIDELVCRLDDYHTKFFWPGKPRWKSPAIRVEPVFMPAATPSERAKWNLRPTIKMPPPNSIVIAVVDVQTNLPVKTGDEILEVDDVPVSDALERSWSHVTCSSMMGKLRGAAWRMLQGTEDRELRLKIRRQTLQGKESVISLTVSRSEGLTEQIISVREESEIPIIRISAWANNRTEELIPRFDSLLEQFRERPGLIIDVGGNGGGQDGLAAQVIARFISAPVIASISFHRLVPGVTFERSVERISPRGPRRYEGRVAVLTDEGCMSATEHFVSGMAEAGALLCGTPTSGACGWIRGINLPRGARLNVSQTFPLHTGGMPSPLMGIAPHIYANRTLADLQAGRDTALLAALNWVKSRDPLPERQQPLAPFAR